MKSLHKRKTYFLVAFCSILLIYSQNAVTLDDTQAHSNKPVNEENDIFFHDINSIMPSEKYDYREFRAAWIATISAIDFPAMGKDENAQKELMLKHLDKLEENNFNVVFLQVKPDAGVIYPSKWHPVTRYFFGTSSTMERDAYPFKEDLLDFFIRESHKRNIEVHAWINPFRLSVTYDTKKSIKSQFSKKNFVNRYIKSGLNPVRWADGRLYIEPGEPVSRKYVIDTVIELVEKYDIDGIHLDDYFYQYSINGKTFKDWPDEKTARKYAAPSGYNRNDKSPDDYGKKGLFAWRRQNINILVNSIYTEIKKRKPYVKFTISPIGIWRNKEAFAYIGGDPNGSDTKSYTPNFDALHADVLLWLLNGEKTESIKSAKDSDGLHKMYIDALIPQIYWDVTPSASFYSMVDWWGEQIQHSRNAFNIYTADIYIGHSLYKVGTKTSREDWTTLDTIKKQINYIRSNKYIKGSAFFTMHNFYTNDRDTKGLGAVVMSNVLKNQYKYKAIVPIMNTIKLREIPPSPMNFHSSISNNVFTLKWIDESSYTLDAYRCPKNAVSISYVLYRQAMYNNGRKGELEIINRVRRNSSQTEYTYSFTETSTNRNTTNYMFYITSLDRLNNESAYLRSKLN